MVDEYDFRAIKRTASIVRSNQWTELHKNVPLDSLLPDDNWRARERVAELEIAREQQALKNLIGLHLISSTVDSLSS